MLSARQRLNTAILTVVLSLGGAVNAARADECGWITAFATGKGTPDAEACADGLCLWRFAYRSEAARAAFEAASGRLERCLGAQMAADDQVNHPDSYELRQFAGQGGTVFLSIKDKASLGETLVFLRTGP